MLLQILASLACVFAAVLQLAVHRSPDCHDTPHTRNARVITVVSLIVAAMVLIDAIAHNWTNPVMSLVFGLFALGQTLFALPHILKEYPWKSHWNSSP